MNNKILKIEKTESSKYLINNTEIKNESVVINKQEVAADGKIYSFKDYDEVEIETEHSICIFSINKSNSGLLEYLEHIGLKISQ